MDAMTTAAIVASVITVVEAVRKKVPKIDGAWVILLAVGVAAVLTFAYAPEASIDRASALALLKRAIIVAGAALGGMTAIDRGAQKLGEGMARGSVPPSVTNVTNVAPPASVVVVPSDRDTRPGG